MLLIHNLHCLSMQIRAYVAVVVSSNRQLGADHAALRQTLEQLVVMGDQNGDALLGVVRRSLSQRN